MTPQLDSPALRTSDSSRCVAPDGLRPAWGIFVIADAWAGRAGTRRAQGLQVPWSQAVRGIFGPLCLHQPALSTRGHGRADGSEPGLWSNSEPTEGPKGLGSCKGRVGETVAEGGSRRRQDGCLMANVKVRGEIKQHRSWDLSASFLPRPPQMTLVLLLGWWKWLYLNYFGGYKNVYICQNSPNCVLQVSAFTSCKFYPKKVDLKNTWCQGIHNIILKVLFYRQILLHGWNGQKPWQKRWKSVHNCYKNLQYILENLIREDNVNAVVWQAIGRQALRVWWG